MANEYVIRIEDGTAQSSSAPVASQNGAQETAGQPKQNKKADATAYIASHAIMPMVKSITAYKTSSVEISTGSRELQQKTDMAMSLVNTGMSTFSTAAAAVSVFGSLGAGIGIGLAVSAINLATQYGIKQAQLQQQMRLEEEQLSLYRSRFGVSFNQSRTGGAT